jgi:hypothetical protein
MFRQSFDDSEPWQTVNLHKDRAIPVEDVPSISNCCKQVTGHIKKVKVDDIKKLMAFIPDTNKKFYSDRIANSSEDSVTRCSESDDECTENVVDQFSEIKTDFSKLIGQL